MRGGPTIFDTLRYAYRTSSKWWLVGAGVCIALAVASVVLA